MADSTAVLTGGWAGFARTRYPLNDITRTRQQHLHPEYSSLVLYSGRENKVGSYHLVKWSGHQNSDCMWMDNAKAPGKRVQSNSIAPWLLDVARKQASQHPSSFYSQNTLRKQRKCFNHHRQPPTETKHRRLSTDLMKGPEWRRRTIRATDKKSDKEQLDRV